MNPKYELILFGGRQVDLFFAKKRLKYEALDLATASAVRDLLTDIDACEPLRKASLQAGILNMAKVARDPVLLQR